jgi:hypothetical protein
MVLGVLLQASLVVAAPAASLFTDAAAGVRFPVPFAAPRFKSSDQVRQLLLQQPGSRLPAGAQFTSGIYSDSATGMPYLLVWKLNLPSGSGPSELAHLLKLGPLETKAGQRPLTVLDWDVRQDLLRATARAELDGGVKSRLLLQILPGSAVYLGFFYTDEQDAKGFDQVIEGFSLLHPEVLTASTSGQGNTKAVAMAATVAILVFTAVFVGGLAWRRRRQVSVAPKKA